MCSPLIKQGQSWDFPGPVIKNIPSRARGAGSIPGQEAKTPHTSGPKKTNQKQYHINNKQ